MTVGSFFPTFNWVLTGSRGENFVYNDQFANELSVGNVCIRFDLNGLRQPLSLST